MIALALLLQAAAPTPAPAPAPERFSILVPVASEPCARQPDDQTIIVCADPLPSQKLPYPDAVVPKGPAASNPNLSGTGALNSEGSPCAAVQRGCQVGFGPPIAPIVAGAASLIGDALRRKPDRRGRVAIPLDDPVPAAK